MIAEELWVAYGILPSNELISARPMQTAGAAVQIFKETFPTGRQTKLARYQLVGLAEGRAGPPSER